jgi:hypothetical protein
MPSCLETSATVRFMGGNNFLKTAAFRSSEYLFISMHFPPPVYPIINSDDATTSLTPGALV